MCGRVCVGCMQILSIFYKEHKHLHILLFSGLWDPFLCGYQGMAVESMQILVINFNHGKKNAK